MARYIRFRSYDAFGFDLDHTLAKYNLADFSKACYDALAKYLVEKKGYSNSLLTPFEKDRDFYFKGLIFEHATGNLLKLDEQGKILRASHGTRMLNTAEIGQRYGKQRLWQFADQLKTTVQSSRGQYHVFDTFFDMPCGILCARMVDLMDKESSQPEENNYTFWGDLVDALNHTYERTAFQEKRGHYFPVLQQDISRYVQPCSERLKSWLKRLKADGRAVFLVTASHVDYTELLCSHMLGENWREYFDIVVTFARKPTFFCDNRPFLRLEGVHEQEPVPLDKLERGQGYSQGSARGLHKFLGRITGKESPKVVYFGDSHRSDIFPAASYTHALAPDSSLTAVPAHPTPINERWTTVLVLEEMEAEGLATGDLYHQVIDSSEPAAKRQAIEDEAVALAEHAPSAAVLSQMEKEVILSSKWGSFFLDDSLGEPAEEEAGPLRVMHTFWGYLLRMYADVAIPHMDYLAGLPLDYPVGVFDHQDPSTCGFFPSPPTPLLEHPLYPKRKRPTPSEDGTEVNVS